MGLWVMTVKLAHPRRSLVSSSDSPRTGSLFYYEVSAGVSASVKLVTHSASMNLYTVCRNIYYKLYTHNQTNSRVLLDSTLFYSPHAEDICRATHDAAECAKKAQSLPASHFQGTLGSHESAHFKSLTPEIVSIR